MTIPAAINGSEIKDDVMVLLHFLSKGSLLYIGTEAVFVVQSQFDRVM